MYIPLSELSAMKAEKTNNNKNAKAAAPQPPFPFPTWRAGDDVPWVGGVLDPTLDEPPPAPSGLEVRDSPDNDDDDDGDGEKKIRGRCVAWDPPPPLPAPAAASSAVNTYIIRTTVKRATDRSTRRSLDGDGSTSSSSSDEKDEEEEEWRSSVEQSARLPTRLCQCNGWKIPVRPEGDDDDKDESDDAAALVVTVRVIAENEAGRSIPAELTFTTSTTDLAAWRTSTGGGVAANGDDGSSSSCRPENIQLAEAPLTPPRDVTIRRIPAVDGGGVLVNWSAPLLAPDLLDADDETKKKTPTTMGYQVTWVGWDEDNMPAVDPLVSVVLSSLSAADDDANSVRRLATFPCDINDDDADSSDLNCFYAGLSTSLRLEGLSDESSYAFSVRGLTPGGPGPMSAPVVVPALTAPEVRWGNTYEREKKIHLRASSQLFKGGSRECKQKQNERTNEQWVV